MQDIEKTMLHIKYGEKPIALMNFLVISIIITCMYYEISYKMCYKTYYIQ